MRGESYKIQSPVNQTLNDEIDKKNQLTKRIKKIIIKRMKLKIKIKNKSESNINFLIGG
jgi:hypothetical protein